MMLVNYFLYYHNGWMDRDTRSSWCNRFNVICKFPKGFWHCCAYRDLMDVLCHYGIKEPQGCQEVEDYLKNREKAFFWKCIQGIASIEVSIFRLSLTHWSVLWPLLFRVATCSSNGSGMYWRCTGKLVVFCEMYWKTVLWN